MQHDVRVCFTIRDQRAGEIASAALSRRSRDTDSPWSKSVFSALAAEPVPLAQSLVAQALLAWQRASPVWEAQQASAQARQPWPSNWHRTGWLAAPAAPAIVRGAFGCAAAAACRGRRLRQARPGRAEKGSHVRQAARGFIFNTGQSHPLSWRTANLWRPPPPAAAQRRLSLRMGGPPPVPGPARWEVLRPGQPAARRREARPSPGARRRQVSASQAADLFSWAASGPEGLGAEPQLFGSSAPCANTTKSRAWRGLRGRGGSRIGGRERAWEERRW